MTDEGGGDTYEGEEGEEVLRLAFIAAVQAAARCQPGHRPLHDPAMPPQPLRGLDSFAVDAGRDATWSEPSPQVIVVVPRVVVKLGGRPRRGPRRRRALRHGDFPCRDDLIDKLDTYVIGHNTTANPYRWAYDGSPLKSA